MAQKENELLLGLEHLMDEFYSHTSDNKRKREIEYQLNAFCMQQDSWRLCIYFMKHSSNQYVLMYSLYQLELVICRQWNCLDAADQCYLKDSLSSFTFALNSTMPNCIRNKLAKVSVEIAKHTWPKFYLEHYNAIMQLLQNEQGQLLGLILLRTTSEEIWSPHSDVASNHKDMLVTFCAEHIPRIFQLLTEILESLSNKSRHIATVPPPPSPTHPHHAPNLVQQLSAASFRPDSREVSREVLSTLQHFFTWVNMAHVPHQLIFTIFKFTNTSSTYAQDDDDMCFLAMTVLNELLYRKCAPPSTRQLFLELYQHTVLLLRDITNPTNNKIDCLGTDFVEKLCEMLSLLVEQHLWRLEVQPNFSAIDFLSYLYQLTMKLPSIDGYLQCLTVWSTFIKQIKPQNAQKYSEALLGVVVAVLNKMQYTNNATQLEELNDTEFNDNHETEWQIFKKSSIEIIAMVAEFSPMETFSQVLAPWEAANDIYGVLRTFDVSGGALHLETAEKERLHCILKDLATLTQTLARLSSYFMDQDAEHYTLSIATIQSLLTKLIDSAALSSTMGFYRLTDDTRLVDDFTQVHCQFLAALKTWCAWYNLNTLNKHKDLNQLLHIVLPLVRTPETIPASVTLAAAHLLLSITAIVHPPDFIQMPPALELLHVAAALRYPPNHSRDVVLCALATFLLRPWGELSAGDAAARSQLIQSLFDAIARDYRQLGETYANAARATDIAAACLPCFATIIDYCKEYPAASKRLLYAALKPTVEHTLAIFPGVSRHAALGELQLQFFVRVLDVLQQQMGPAAISAAVEVFFAVANREQQSNRFGGLDMFLKILQLVIEAPGSSYKIFMQGIFELCMKDIYPALIQQANEYPDAIIALINLLHSVLLNRWNYFYVSQIRLGNSPGCSDVEPAADSPQQQEQLLQVLQVFGQCLLQSDINTFRVSLTSMENLNAKWKLYHKALFKERMLSQFLNVLLQTMLDKTHHLLNEDIMQAIYNMAAVSFPMFFDHFLTQYITNLKALTPQQRNTVRNNFTNSTDMPTFVQNLQRFINDVRCFMLCNSSLPAGSVVL